MFTRICIQFFCSLFAGHIDGKYLTKFIFPNNNETDRQTQKQSFVSSEKGKQTKRYICLKKTKEKLHKTKINKFV